ncbi:histidine kinase [Parabacteroides sp. OttesenSCG-928-G06]|nr:histidine kinase [Parabacteroides sp. OttesenSCG-928-G06]
MNILESHIHSHQESFFYKLLMDRNIGYRIGRHTLFVLAILAVAINQVYMGFLEYHALIGNKMYLLILFVLATYLLLGYFNIYVLVPRLLLKEKYAGYFTSFFLLVIIFLFLHYGLEYAVFKYYNLNPGVYSYFGNAANPLWLDMLSTFFVDSIAILGVSFMIIFKHWLINDSEVHALENLHMQSEVEKLKEQINPEFLLSILHNVGDIAGQDQEKASDMLMDLSEILRYQLYDCNRREVLLYAEIRFINNFLQLEKRYDEKMDFNVTTTGDAGSLFIPPLLFLPIVQYAVKKRKREPYPFLISLSFQVNNDSFSLICSCPDADMDDIGLKNIRLRLDKLYHKRYSMQITSGEDPALHLNIKF